MTTHSPITTTTDAMTEQAVAWFVRMQSDQRTLGDEDRFAQWLKQDLRHGQVYAQVENVWRAAGPEIGPRIIDNDSRPQMLRKKRASRVWWSIASAAAVIAAVTVGISFLKDRAGISTGTYATQAGVQRELRLADGSTIVLNTRSEVSVDLIEHQRSIRLTRGEARFLVAKDAARPFIVDTGAAQVRAVGTAFDVRVSDERVAVTLVEGKVEVTPTSPVAGVAEPTLLTAGEKFSLEVSSGDTHVETVRMDRVSAWLDRQLIFDSTPLAAAVEEANRYLPTQIVIGDPSVADIRVSGVVRAGNVESFVGSLESSFPIQAIKRPDGRVALMRRVSDEGR